MQRKTHHVAAKNVPKTKRHLSMLKAHNYGKKIAPMIKAH